MTIHHASKKINATLISDSPGSILDRISKSWMEYSRDVDYKCFNSSEVHPFLCCIRSCGYGVTHWVDNRAYRQFCSSLIGAQVAMIHHATDQELPDTIRSLKYCDGITTGSYGWKVRLERISNREVTLIPYTLDSRQFAFNSNQKASRQRFGIPENKYVLGFVGKAAADAFGRKGVDLFINVLKMASRIWDDLAVVLVGPGWEPLKLRLEVLGLDVYCFEVKTTEGTAELYPLMDVLLVTAKEEGGPCTVLEAMSCGTPVVASNVGHVPECVADGETGFVCFNREVDEYIRHIKSLRSNASLRKNIVLKAREYIERKRDNRAVLPSVKFDDIYINAARAYKARKATEILKRIPSSFCSAMHCSARSLKKWLST